MPLPKPGFDTTAHVIWWAVIGWWFYLIVGLLWFGWLFMKYLVLSTYWCYRVVFVGLYKLGAWVWSLLLRR